jgi:predicted nucleotidyltransferase
MVAEHRGEIILCDVYGSTARGTDTPWSDLEMTFIVRDGSKVQGRHFIYRDIAIGFRAMERRKLEELLSNPSLQTASSRWPFWMGMLSMLKVLYGDPAPIKAWLQLGEAVPPEQFREALEENLPDL